MQGMRDLLRGSLGQSLKTLAPLDRLAAAWPVACGPVLAAKGQLIEFERGRLTVRVEDAAWRDQLRSSHNRLRRELAHIASVELREIHFEGGPEGTKRSAGQQENERYPYGKQR